MDSHENQNSNAAAIIETAIATTEPKLLEAGAAPLEYAIVVPGGGRVERVTVDQERDATAPRRTKGTFTLATVDSFISYVKARATDALTIWVDEDRTKLTAVFNDATPDTPAWRDHRAECSLTLSEEWKRWVGSSGKMLDQQTFAEHIEDGLAEIREPDAATMLEIAQTFHAHTNAEFKSGQRLTSGEVKFVYTEDLTASAGANKDLEIPEILKLGIPVFLGEDAYAIDARLRYRLRAGDLTLGYKLDHPERVMHDAIELIGVRLTEELSEPGRNRVYIGTAPAAA